MSIRRVEVIDEGSPVRTPSRRILPDMSQWDMIPDPLHVRRSMEQENNHHHHHHHHHQRHTGTEDLDRESSPEEADDKENSGNQRRPRSSTSSSQRSPLGEVPESDPRRSSERPFEAHPLSQEVFFSPSPAVGPSTTYNSSTNTAFVPAVTAMPARIPPPASSRTDSFRSTSTHRALPGTRGNTASPSTISSRRRHPGQAVAPRTAPQIPPGGSHASAAQRQANRIPYPDERVAPVTPSANRNRTCAHCGGVMTNCVAVDRQPGVLVCSVGCKMAVEDRMELRERSSLPASAPFRLCARCLKRTNCSMMAGGQWVCSVTCKLAWEQDDEAKGPATARTQPARKEKAVWGRFKLALKNLWKKK